MTDQKLHPEAQEKLPGRALRERFRWIETALRNGERLPSKAYRAHYGLSEGSLSKDLDRYLEVFHALGGSGERRHGWIEVQEWPDGYGIVGTIDSVTWHELTCPGGIIELRASRLDREDPEVMQVIGHAIRARQCVALGFVLGGPGAEEVTLSPHSLVRMRGHLHLRGYDHKLNLYRNVPAAGVAAARPATGLRYFGAEADDDWNTEVDLHVSVRADLPPEQKVQAAMEVGLASPDDHFTLRVKKALVRDELNALGPSFEVLDEGL